MSGVEFKSLIPKLAMLTLCVHYEHLNCNYRPQTKFAKVMFLHLYVILPMGGCLGPGPGGVSRPRPRKCLPGRGVSRPRPGGVCILACTEADHSKRLLLRTVSILLKCILVNLKNASTL